MALQFKKKVEPEVTGVIGLSSNTAHIVDKYVQVHTQLEEVMAQAKPLSLKLAEYQETLLQETDSLPAESEILLKGDFNTLKIGPKGNATRVTASVTQVFDILGEDLFKQVVKFGITELKKYANAKQLEQITVTERTGKRPVKIV